MARPLRLEYPGALYHVTSRGNAQADIYVDEADRRIFLRILGSAVQKQRWLLHAFCLMGNHYHLLVETPQPNLSRGMHQLNGVYSQCFNRRHHRVGHVLQGRFTAILVERGSYLLELARYVPLNPVRAGMVALPEEWSWSSYRATAGLEPTPPWLTTCAVLERFAGEADRSRGRFFWAAGNLPSAWSARCRRLPCLPKSRALTVLPAGLHWGTFYRPTSSRTVSGATPRSAKDTAATAIPLPRSLDTWVCITRPCRALRTPPMPRFKT